MKLLSRLVLVFACVMPLPAAAANVCMYVGPTGQTLYGRVEETAGNFVAFALAEGTGGAKGKYYATEANIVAAGLDTAGTFLLTVHYGATPSTTAEDPIVAFDDAFGWSGAAYLADGAYTVSAILVDEDDSWTFDSPTQITSAKILAEGKSPAVMKAMDFAAPATKWGSLSSITSVTIADVGGATKPTIVSSALSLDKKKVNILFNAESATTGTYTVTVKVATTDSQTLVRKGRLNIE